jgi:CRISPR-associated protein Csx10
VTGEEIKTLLAEPILIGRSRRAGYGGVGAIMFALDTDSEYGRVTGALSRQVEGGTSIRVLLTSAYIGRHPVTGQIDPTALDDELAEQLGGGARVEQRYWSFETVGGFNQKWRNELPQTLAVAAGAVLVLRVERPISADVLRRIEHEGLGERRMEGFGRMLFLAPTDDREPFRLRAIALERVEPPPTATGQDQAGGPAQEHLEFLERRIVLAAAAVELERLAADLARGATGRIPTNSLLGRLRTVLRPAQDNRSAEDALRTLATWCRDVDPHSDGARDALKKPARDHLAGCSVGNADQRRTELLGWLREIAGPRTGTTRWDALMGAVRGPLGSADTLTGLAQRHHLRGTAAAQAILEEHAALLSVQLADGLLAALARRNRGGA